MNYLSSSQLRRLFLSFFRDHKNHNVIKSSSLIPDSNDRSVLFTTAGVQSLMRFMYNDEKCELGNRVVGLQKCVRMDDIDKVGDSNHLVFFEMLGSWSFDDYFKNDSISYTFEFLTDENFLNIPVNLLGISVFSGNDNVSFDKESYDKWLELGINKDRIVKCGTDRNWWGPIGNEGPCGPDTEVFCWIGSDPAPDFFDINDDRWIEIWNNVFIEYERINGKHIRLKQKNVDTGMGLERILTVIQKKDNCYETDLFKSIFSELENILIESKIKYNENSLMHKRIIADHLRSSVFIVSDGIIPGNLGRGYILRRLIRRTIRSARILGILTLFTRRIVTYIINNYSFDYPEILKNKNIISIIELEEEKFSHVLDKGNVFLEDLFKNSNFLVGDDNKIKGKDVFFIYTTYGFPVELIEKYANKYGFQLNIREFDELYKEHQNLSRKSINSKFKCGMNDKFSDANIKLHTTTHILHESLKRILGDHVEQKGSDITPERLRFDFNHHSKLTDIQIKDIENMVNEIINRDLKVEYFEYSLKEAIDKYGTNDKFTHIHKKQEKIRIYKIDDFNLEVCSGPHVDRTSNLGGFKIIKEESSGKGIRRIRAILKETN